MFNIERIEKYNPLDDINDITFEYPNVIWYPSSRGHNDIDKVRGPKIRKRVSKKNIPSFSEKQVVSLVKTC